MNNILPYEFQERIRKQIIDTFISVIPKEEIDKVIDAATKSFYEEGIKKIVHDKLESAYKYQIEAHLRDIANLDPKVNESVKATIVECAPAVLETFLEKLVKTISIEAANNIRNNRY